LIASSGKGKGKGKEIALESTLVALTQDLLNKFSSDEPLPCINSQKVMNSLKSNKVVSAY
jgi:hypothetical protein